MVAQHQKHVTLYCAEFKDHPYYIVADTNVSPFARTGNICCGHKFCVRDTKNVSDFVQKHFVSAANVSHLRSPRNLMSNNVSSIAKALMLVVLFMG